MTVYAVLAPPADAGPAGPEPERFVFVKEGFCWPAFYLTAIWLVWRRMWLVLVLYLAAAAGIVWLASEAPVPVAWLIVLLFGVLVALEANNLRRWTLERRGFRFVGVASGDNLREAEFRFFANWRPSPPRRPLPEPAGPLVGPPSAGDEVVGLFPRPGGLP